MSTPFDTVAGPGESAFVVLGSRFRGFVRRARSVAAAEELHEAVRADHPEATHVIPAYRIRTEDGMLRAYASDEGEPTGAAGQPALSVLEGRNLEQCVAVVVRHHGGQNLGVGGLVRSYSRAVSEAVSDAGVTTARPRERLAVTVGYDDSGTVRSILESEGVGFEAEYRSEVRFSVCLPAEDAPALIDRIASATSGRAAVAREP